MGLIVVDNAHKQVHDLLLDVRPQHHELAIHAVQDCLEVVTLPRVLRIKQFQETVYKVIRDVAS